MKNVTKRKFTANLKNKIAIEVLKQKEALSQIASKTENSREKMSLELSLLRDSPSKTNSISTSKP